MRARQYEEILDAIFPADQETTLPLNPGKETFNQPAPLVAVQSPAVLRDRFDPVPSIWHDYLNTFLTQFLIQLVAVVRAITNQVLGFRLDHAVIEAQLHQGNFMVIRRVRADRRRQSMTINNCHDFHILAMLRRTDLVVTTLYRGKGGVAKGFRFVTRTFIPQCVGKIGQCSTQHFAAAPVLKAAMQRFVVRVALGQHVPLRTGIENPEDGFENLASGCRLAARTTGRNMLLRKLFPDALPLLVA